MKVRFFDEPRFVAELDSLTTMATFRTTRLEQEEVEAVIHIAANLNDEEKLQDIPIFLGIDDRIACFVYGPKRKFGVSSSLSLIETTKRQTSFILKIGWAEETIYFPILESDRDLLLQELAKGLTAWRHP